MKFEVKLNEKGQVEFSMDDPEGHDPEGMLEKYRAFEKMVVRLDAIGSNEKLEPLVLKDDPKEEPATEAPPPSPAESAPVRGMWSWARTDWRRLVVRARERREWEKDNFHRVQSEFLMGKAHNTLYGQGYVCDKLKITPDELVEACTDHGIKLYDRMTTLEAYQALCVMDYMSVEEILARMHTRIEREDYWYDIAYQQSLAAGKVLDAVRAEVRGLRDLWDDIGAGALDFTQHDTIGAFSSINSLRACEVVRLLALPGTSYLMSASFDVNSPLPDAAYDKLQEELQPARYMDRIKELLNLEEKDGSTD